MVVCALHIHTQRFCAVLLALSLVNLAAAWRQWTWASDGPAARSGHSFLQWNNSAFVFGGRGSNIQRYHNPRTYEVERVGGDLQFITYDTRPTFPCPVGTPEAECYNITVGQLYNDLWEYDLDCFRFDDFGCMSQGWSVVDAGAPIGGCRIDTGEYVCSHPNERYDHSAAIFDDGTLFVYGGFSKWCQDFCSDMWAFSIPDCKDRGLCTWHQLADVGNAGPGRRWRATVVGDGTHMFLFGGHRMWHGFGKDNTRSNSWQFLDQFPLGGYLDDLWVYEHSGNASQLGKWHQILPLETCHDTPGRSWEQLFDITCTITWPSPRASAALEIVGGELFLHGGYTSYYPYPDADSAGAGRGVARATQDLTSGQPFGASVHYLGDMWVYNVSSGLWRTAPAKGAARPPARRDHIMVRVHDTLMVIGGYRSNFYSNDVWVYNLTTQEWLLKDTFPHALYPPSCTSDSIPLSDGTDFILSRSVQGQPTRGFPVDGLDGRASEHIFIAQARRQAPGWDGCRDRHDGRKDLPDDMQVLQYSEPAQRAGHGAFFSGKHGIVLVHGGIAYLQEEADLPSRSHAFATTGDMWQFNLNRCIKNCSNHGVCAFGRCFCDPGYYGLDCSNVTCPGDFCYYDPSTHEQVCKHCCHATTQHEAPGGDKHVYNERKVACDHEHPGESHGICDGYGQCQCRPPFVGEDCSIRDCPNACSGNGYCAEEYPVGRCICEGGWEGLDCSTSTSPRSLVALAPEPTLHTRRLRRGMLEQLQLPTGAVCGWRVRLCGHLEPVQPHHCMVAVPRRGLFIR